LTAKARKERKFRIAQIVTLAGILILLFLRRILLAKILLGLMLLGYLYLEIDYCINKMRINSLKKAICKNPSDKSFERIINAFISIYDPQNALVYSSEAIAKYPNSASLLTLRAIALRQIDKDDKAIPLIKRALELEPNNELAKEQAHSLESIGFKVFS
jgi:tetratricopeptide (TPR) repeat protein